jgi:hypothetical protein
MTLVDRLKAQAEEAKVQGLTKVAANLEDQIESVELRDDDSFYVYAQEDFESDMEGLLWNAAVRAADFYGCGVDALKVQDIVKRVSKELSDEIRVQGGVVEDVGAYEPVVPGELYERTAIEVEESD